MRQSLGAYEESPSRRPVRKRMAADHNGAIGSGGFIVAVITIVIALALLPVVLDFVNDTDMRANLSNTQVTLLDLTPTFYLIGVFVGLISWLAITKRAG